MAEKIIVFSGCGVNCAKQANKRLYVSSFREIGQEGKKSFNGVACFRNLLQSKHAFHLYKNQMGMAREFRTNIHPNEHQIESFGSPPLLECELTQINDSTGKNIAESSSQSVPENSEKKSLLNSVFS